MTSRVPCRPVRRWLGGLGAGSRQHHVRLPRGAAGQGTIRVPAPVFPDRPRRGGNVGRDEGSGAANHREAQQRERTGSDTGCDVQGR